MAETRRLIQPLVSFRDAAFDTSHCEKFCLALRVGEGMISLTVLDNLTNDFLAFEEYQFKKANSEKDLAEELGRLIAEHEWMSGGFKRVDAMVVTERFTLVPSAFFDSAKQNEFLSFNHPVDESDVLHTDVLRNADARVIYAVSSSLDKILHGISSSIRIRHHLSPFIERALSVNKNKTDKRVAVNVQKGSFDLVITESGKLLLANTFRYQTSEDLVYFLLFSCEQLKMNPDQMEVEMVGEVATDSAPALLARKYIRNISFGSKPVDARFAKEFDQFPAHYYHTLFSLHYFS